MTRPLTLSVLLCAALVLSGLGASFAAAKAPAQDQYVLCTGFGTTVIYVDAEGAPTTPPELCAEALKSTLALAPELARIDPIATTSRTSDKPGIINLVSWVHVVAAMARAPPFQI